jgi:TolA-binding protein
MTITTTNGDLLRAYNSGSVEAIQRVKVSALGVAQAQRLKKALRKMQQQIEDYNETRNDMLEEYGVRQSDGTYNIDKATKKKKDMFLDLVDDLLDVEVEIEVTPIQMTEPMAEVLDMSVYVNLWFLFEDDDADSPGGIAKKEIAKEAQ